MFTVLQRLAWSLIILLGVTLVTFGLAFVVPSDPARTLAGPKADPQTVASIRRELGLDQPLPVQYLRYLARVARGDFGRSYLTRETVLRAVLERLPATAFLALTSLTVAALAGLLFGTLSAWRQGSAVDLAVLIGALVLLSLPAFWV